VRETRVGGYVREKRRLKEAIQVGEADFAFYFCLKLGLAIILFIYARVHIRITNVVLFVLLLCASECYASYTMQDALARSFMKVWVSKVYFLLVE